MDTKRLGRTWTPLLGSALLLAASEAPAAVSMQGDVTLDYYVADVDPEGFESVDSAFYVEQVANSGTSATGPLSLAGWFTTDSSPAGDGTDVAETSIGTLGGSSSLLNVSDVAAADDAAPGEYYVHVLLQDDDYPGTYEDSRSLTPNLLWRGGLEAVGPLQVTTWDGGTRASVDFAELRNNRLDARYTNGVDLTLYATRGFGPASDGYTLCTVRVAGVYAGDTRYQPGFDCTLNRIPDGDYTLHLDVAEAGGRGGYSTLSGADVHFTDGYYSDGYSDGSVYVAGAFGPMDVLVLVLLGLPGLARRRSKS